MSIKDKLFFGEHPASIDDRGRIPVIKEFRELILEGDDFFVLRVPQKSSPYKKPVFLVYPESFYENALRTYLEKPQTNPDRALFFSANRQELVSHNRIQLPLDFLKQYYWNHFHRSLPAVLCGNGNCFYVVPLIEPSRQQKT